MKREVEVNAEGLGEEKDERNDQSRRKKSLDEKSFADDDQQKDPQEGNEGYEDLSMFERNLQLPEEGANVFGLQLTSSEIFSHLFDEKDAEGHQHLVESQYQHVKKRQAQSLGEMDSGQK